MTGPEFLDSPRSGPDFDAADEMAQWAVDNAELLAMMHASSPKRPVTQSIDTP